ncbi:hypothetical protein FQA47_018313 [Oryzias melastigma]|uniref:Uncharacterized protein n=1 Tax=Oryzias melastigma TaxID=30732 RepID=A0A834L1A4_ORYME|nr:hypothetical protein FQA47_018313 [Oryzias melastigma]
MKQHHKEVPLEEETQDEPAGEVLDVGRHRGRRRFSHSVFCTAAVRNFRSLKKQIQTFPHSDSSSAEDNMENKNPADLNRLKEAVLGFALGALGGCILGVTEDPVDRILLVMTAEGPLTPVMQEVQTVGPLGLGTLLGATALTTATTSVIAGVILAAAVASVFVALKNCGASFTPSAGLWVSAGVAGAFGTTLSGATFGATVEWIVNRYSMVGLFWTLSLFTVLKPPLSLLFKILWSRGEACCSLGSEVSSREREQIEMAQWQQRQRLAMQMEQRILTLEKGGSPNGPDSRETRAYEQREREELERRRTDKEEAEMQQRTIQDWINTVVIKHVDFLAFSGIPMTVVAIVTSGFGMSGYGDHQVALIALLALVAIITYFLLSSNNFKFWMLVGCMGMLATFVIAMLTLHAGQTALMDAKKMRAAGRSQSREDISSRMNLQSSLEALNAAFFVAKLCQLGLGATVGGALVRRGAGEAKVIAGAAALAGSLLAGQVVLAPALSEGGNAGALLGVVATAGVSVGGAAAAAGGSSSWWGTLATTGGLVLGALALGQWHAVNIGLQVPAAFVFAMINPF